MTELEGYTKFCEIDEKKLELQWIARINKLLVGKKIIKVDYMPEKLAKKQGWYNRPIQILLNNGTWLTPSMDDEGNDGGALFTSDEDLPTIPVMR